MGCVAGSYCCRLVYPWKMPSTSMPASKNEFAAAEITALAAGAGPPENTIATRLTASTMADCRPRGRGLPSPAASALLGVTGMTIDAQSLGFETPPTDFDYTWRDTVLYALGVGASADGELDYLYEGRGPKVIPTFCTVPTFAVFDALVDRIGCDRQGMVHHSQQVDVFKPLPPNGRLRVTGRVAALYDLKRLAMSVFSIDAHDENDELAIRGEVTLALLNDGGFGGERPPKTHESKRLIATRTSRFTSESSPARRCSIASAATTTHCTPIPSSRRRLALTARSSTGCAPTGTRGERWSEKPATEIPTGSRCCADSSATRCFREIRSSFAAGTRGTRRSERRHRRGAGQALLAQRVRRVALRNSWAFFFLPRRRSTHRVLRWRSPPLPDAR